jgi:polar amino acid transport system permease protein
MSEKQSSAWSPSSREIQRRKSRRAISRKQAGIAAASSIFVLGTLLVILVTSPGWETVKTTFFDIEYGKEVFPTVIKGLWINLQLTFIGGAAIGVIALGLALLRTTKSPALTPFRFLATAYVDIFRGAPLILIILLVGFRSTCVRSAGSI